jgi:hypothetical protein
VPTTWRGAVGGPCERLGLLVRQQVRTPHSAGHQRPTGEQRHRPAGFAQQVGQTASMQTTPSDGSDSTADKRSVSRTAYPSGADRVARSKSDWTLTSLTATRSPRPRFLRGARVRLEVAANPDKQQLPSTDATVKLSEASFEEASPGHVTNVVVTAVCAR